MKLIDLIKMGLRNLFRRKARTILTIVGMVIGTISIMVMLSISVGMEERFAETIKENGSLSMITVSTWAGVEDSDGNVTDWKEQKLTDELVEKLRTIEHVKSVSPSRYFYGGQLISGKYQSWGSLQLVDFDSWELFGYPPLEDGTYPTKADKNMFLIGKSAVNEFYTFQGNRYKTKDIDLDKDKVVYTFNEYQVKKGKKKVEIPVSKNYKRIDSPEYSEFEYNIYMDIDYFKECYETYVKSLSTTDRKKAMENINKYDNIILNCDNIDNVIPVQDEIKKLGFQTESQMKSMQPLIEASNMLELVLLAIGAIAMIVSAINIANTMIMSIYERTKEIGIMKVLGCLVGDIRKLFLFEAGMLGLIGGIIGVGLSYLVSFALNKYGGALFTFLSVEGAIEEGTQISVIPFWLPILGALFGCVVGVISGFFPSLRATRISAIEAMKTEN